MDSSNSHLGSPLPLSNLNRKKLRQSRLFSSWALEGVTVWPTIYSLFVKFRENRAVFVKPGIELDSMWDWARSSVNT